MTLYSVKPRFQALLAGLAQTLARRGVSADQITYVGLALALAAGAVLALGGQSLWLWLVPPLLLGRIACNALDGMVARLTRTGRPFGMVLNEVCDRLADLACLGGLLLGAPQHALVAASLLPLTLLVSFLGVVPQAAGGARLVTGPMGKADRMLALALYCIAVPLAPPAGAWIVWVMLGGLVLTCLRRALALRVAVA